MGITSIVHLTSHLQNAARARLGLTSVPHCKYNLGLLLALHRAGYLSFVTRGDTMPPNPETIATYEPPPLTTANVAKQRLWVGLKYVNNEPVLGNFTAISTPKRNIHANLAALNRLSRGFSASYQQGLNLGESMFVTTSAGTLEIREAIQRKVGGTLLCRVGL
ncbi:ribosomal protein S8 [Xylaria bambusicola]|uniref:ribosomal protein S8 n=1 Tax=Xylaria bambusicola TaxID=326684 RepID=UPI0020075977|nr:ribosomal protein S8 [Xylaria bambusicola]KAI0512951.1 ribosomal protein S8 [Xylaria bambusicola]